MNQPASQSRSPLRMVVEALKGLLAGIVGALLALFSGLVVLLGILVSVLPLLLVIGAVAGGIYLIVH